MPGPSHDPNKPLPQRVMPQQRKGDIEPDQIYDMTLGPGDSAVQAAYARTSKGTTYLGTAALPRLPTGRAEGNDSLMIARRARRARSLTFTVQGIMWRAGFAPDVAQTPLGQATPFRTLPEAEAKSPSGAILRPVDTMFELVFRELIPRPLTAQGDQMYGPVRRLESIALYYFPTGEGATAGMMAQYADQPASRAHVLYLQTNIKNASPTVLEQIQKTFLAAVPRAMEAAKQPEPGNFWQELDRAAYQVSATFKNSALGGNTRTASATIKKQARRAGGSVDQAFSLFSLAGWALEGIRRVSGRAGVAVVRAVTGMLVKVIQTLDRLAQPRG